VADVIVSYDGTPNDDDALALALALTGGRGGLALAYVRHSREFDPRREELAQHDAERRLQTGADLIGEAAVSTHVLFSASTDAGLEQLAAEQDARLIVFGSDYRTAPGRAEPGNAAQRLLDGGPVAIAVASAGLRLHPDAPIRTITVPSPAEDPAVAPTASALAATLGARVALDGPPVGDLILVGSRASIGPGRVSLTGSARSALNTARGSVLILARETPLEI
jgi:nucleotide-binding universal stress UspA family protein